VLNGGGALTDFGCYGANLMTWLMKGERPIAVTALTHTNKPDVYPKVEDEATVLVQYEKAQGIIQASWNWPFGRKDMEVYGVSGYVIADNSTDMRIRLPRKNEMEEKAQPLVSPEHNNITYLKAVLDGSFDPTGSLSSLDNNMIVTEILDAARESAASGKTIYLQ
jgi:predicted dehydrogenase